MNESDIVVRPMDSATYTVSSRLQASGLAAGIRLFEQAARTATLPQAPRPITIADYGAANGYNSLQPLKAVISAVRTRTRPEHAILVTHTDLPDNDFTALFTTLANEADSYLKGDRATFASAVGRSFYEQILPSGSVTLGWSSWATHWLSRVPAQIPDHIHIAHSADADARRAYSRQAAMDWHDFLAFRGREVAPGGRMVVVTLGLDDAGQAGFGAVMEALAESLHILVERGTLRPEELRRMAVPTVGRSRKELLAPFAPSGRFEGLSVEHLELCDVEDQFWARYLVDGDPAAFGAGWAGFARAAIFPTLATALDSATRPAMFLEELASELTRRVAAKPRPTAIPLAVLVAAKRPLE